jgi:hypothetical protein
MNVDRGKESFTPEEIEGLRARVLVFKAEQSLSWPELAKRTDVAGGTLSVWATGKYNGDNAGVAYKVNRFFLAEAGFAQIHSRVSFPRVYDRPYAEDVALLLDAWSVKHPKEREFLTAIAMRPGCLRNLSETLELATLTARGTDEDRTLDHMKSAWAQRQLRPIAA